MARNSTSNPRPPLACEITAERVIAARADPSRQLVEQSAARTLPPGAVAPSLAASNVASYEALVRALESSLAALGGRGREVSLVVPDAAARLMLLDFDSLPDRESEAASLVRFRLKKLLPFDSERAAVSFHSWRVNGGVRVAAAVALGSVIDEYEQAVRAAGYQPGVVLPSIAAALGVVTAPEASLVIKGDRETTTIAIVEQDELRLVRTLEHAAQGALSPEQLAEDVYPLIVFFEETYSARISRVLVAGNAATDAVRAQFESQAGARVEELVPGSAFAPTAGPDSLPRGLLAGVVGALLG